MVSNYVKTPGIDTYTAGKDTVAVVVGNDEVHILNESAAQILEHCTGSSADEICSALEQAYPDASTETIRTDVTDTLEQLRSKGLVRFEQAERKSA